MIINTKKFLDKIIMYSYIYTNKNYKDSNIIKDLILFNKTVCRQTPSIIINKKNEIISVKTTLRDLKLNMFLYKLKIFTLPKMKKDLILDNNIFKLDNNYNIYIILKNKNYFFEYKTDLKNNFNYTFVIKLIFNKNITNKNKINYINKILKIKL
ncbi:ribosomal protein L5 (apicoplast) [Theileria orientalis]|uniref:Ribosomal protein L5 n=1 Tax=Theileria orientalis TaxID=68886 RepID=A0A976XIX9_THEOR|nr:ribosomal protein L5 [Theileria orientalis]